MKEEEKHVKVEEYGPAFPCQEDEDEEKAFAEFQCNAEPDATVSSVTCNGTLQTSVKEEEEVEEEEYEYVYLPDGQ